ncbi:MAG TPA: acyl carrier protein [Vicinamibacterales bacterium]
MSSHERVMTIIYRAIDDVNSQLPAGSRLRKEPETVLFGREAGLDSLGLVNLIVGLEKHIEQDLGRTVPLTDPELLSAAESPFATVESLARHITSRLG